MSRVASSSIAALAAAALLAGCDGGQPTFKGVDITGADYGKSLALTGHDGKPRTLADFRGKVVVLTFGFTQCPDVCPTTLADAAQALKSLGPDAERVQVLFVTLDPERDTPALLAKYVPAFDPRFLGLYGDAEATKRVAQEFKIFYQKVQGSPPGSYSVDHSAQSYVLDAQGRLRLFVRHERLGADLADDLRVLLRKRAG
jgi:protein SCO1/2